MHSSLEIISTQLCPHVNDHFYSQAEVKVTGKKSGTWKIKKGQSVTYGVTMIKNSTNPEPHNLILLGLLSLRVIGSRTGPELWLKKNT